MLFAGWVILSIADISARAAGKLLDKAGTIVKRKP